MLSSYIQICHFLNWMNISKLLAANDYERTNIRSNYIIRQLCGAYKLVTCIKNHEMFVVGVQVGKWSVKGGARRT
jgi:hypothetical protein